MSVELAIAVSTQESTSVVRKLGSTCLIRAQLSEEVAGPRVEVAGGDLLRVDFSTQPPKVVYRWWKSTVAAVGSGSVTVVKVPTKADPSLSGRAWMIAALGSTPAVGDAVFLDTQRSQPVVVDVVRDGEPAHPERFGEGYDVIADEIADLARWRRPAGKLHDDAVEVDEGLVRRLLAGQFSAWADLPLRSVRSTGTVHALYRLGPDMVVRLPLTPRWHSLEKERHWLPWLARQLPLNLPTPLAEGRPDEGYPWSWGVFRWLEGETWAIDRVFDPCRAALDLAAFLTALHQLDPTGAPTTHPGVPGRSPLADRDEAVRGALVAARGMLDTDAIAAAWTEALQAPAWVPSPTWVHGDVLAGNVLVVAGRLHAVIDWGSVGLGDPACDLTPAWSLFSGESRTVFRDAMAADDATWARARGWAITRICAIPYYAETNPLFAADARNALEQALADDPGRW